MIYLDALELVATQAAFHGDGDETTMRLDLAVGAAFAELATPETVAALVRAVKAALAIADAEGVCIPCGRGFDGDIAAALAPFRDAP